MAVRRCLATNKRTLPPTYVCFLVFENDKYFFFSRKKNGISFKRGGNANYFNVNQNVPLSALFNKDMLCFENMYIQRMNAKLSELSVVGKYQILCPLLSQVSCIPRGPGTFSENKSQSWKPSTISVRLDFIKCVQIFIFLKSQI